MQDQKKGSQNGTLDEHDRERQHSENARCNAQSCVIIKNTKEVRRVIRDQSTEDNDDETERRR